MATGTEKYYDKRASEYDRVYEKPERQDDIAELGAMVGGTLAGRRVLELATGTGFWTQHYADDATTVTATDINDSTLAVARRRRAWPDNVCFLRADAFDLARIDGNFDAVFAGFLWSHVPLDRLDGLLDEIVERVEPGAVVLFADNNYVHGSNHSVVRTDEDGNTFQRRKLSDGTEWEVLKNFPDSKALEARLRRYGAHVEVRSLKYFWMSRFETRAD